MKTPGCVVLTKFAAPEDTESFPLPDKEFTQTLSYNYAQNLAVIAPQPRGKCFVQNLPVIVPPSLIQCFVNALWENPPKKYSIMNVGLLTFQISKK